MRRKLREHVKESFDREFGSKSKSKKKKSTKSRTSPLYSTENIPRPIPCDDKQRGNSEDGETTKSTNTQNGDRSTTSKNTPHSHCINGHATNRKSKGNGNGHGDKRRRKKQRRKKKRNKKRTANHVPIKKESHRNTSQCKGSGISGSGSERTESASTDTVSVSLSMSTSLSPACESMLSQKELDELSLNEKTATMTNSTKISVESESGSDRVEPLGTDPFDGSVASGSLDRDIDDGDHEDSFVKSLDAEHALTADEMESKSKEEALCLTADDGECKEGVFGDDVDTEHGQNEEIRILKQSVSTLIDTVSKLEELVLFHQNNAIPPRTTQHCYEYRDDLQNEMDSLSISEEIESLKQRVRDLERGHLTTRFGSEQHEELRRWLTDEVALGQYFDILVDHGFEDLVAVQTLTMDILDAVEGIDKIGHKTRIMYFVQKLRDSAQCLDQMHEF